MTDQTSAPADESRIQDYLAGRLDAAEAERFEQRMFADDAFAAEVERALEIRAAAPHAGTTRRASSPPRRIWLAFAAAAGTAVIATGIVWLQRPSEPPLFRGVEQRMGLEIDVNGAALLARWRSVSGAAGYEVQLLDRDGDALLTLNVDDPSAALLLSPVDGSEPAFIEVSALDELGQTLQHSERVALPGR